MSVALAAPTVAQRGGLFGIVVGVHLALLGVLTLGRVEIPPVLEPHTIAVELLPMVAGAPAAQPKSALPVPIPPEPRLATVRPRPVSRPAVKVPVPVSKTSEPQSETMVSALPAESVISPSSSSLAATAAASAPATSGGGSGGSSIAGASSPGDDTSQARFDADYLRNPAPPYPAISRRMREEGKVILRVSVTPTGTAESVEVKASSGSTRLDEAALRTVRQWRFIPARGGDVAVQSWVLVPVIFKLEW